MNVSVRKSTIAPTMSRHELRSGVGEWLAQLEQARPVPLRPQSSLRALLSAENVVLAVMVAASIVIYLAVKAGAL
jgi:hypothetical protein